MAATGGRLVVDKSDRPPARGYACNAQPYKKPTRYIPQPIDHARSGTEQLSGGGSNAQRMDLTPPPNR
jgi:hypothetical protein